MNSVPKAGTHLLGVALRAMPASRDSGVFLSHLGHDGAERRLVDSTNTLSRVRSGYFVSGHMPWTSGDGQLLERLGYRSLLLIRDPRDLLLSQIDHAVERPVNRYHQTLVALPDRYAQLAFVLHGGPLSGSQRLAPAFGSYLQSYIDWNDALVVRFEDLAGQRAGADPGVQARTLRKIGAHFAIDLSDSMVEDIVQTMGTSKTPTLRKGHIDRWRTEFTPGMRALAKESLGDLISELGYQW
ncbi:MAG: hypothetical protein R8J94_00715 [Acidimicrobiia bacterium]|nr:hypothetical protein [Acidimicrobiia bacterium]